MDYEHHRQDEHHNYQQQYHHEPQVATIYPPQVVVQQPPVVTMVVGQCPACRVGIMQDDFTLCGIICAVLFFPIGVLCCWAMRERRCNHCGASYT